MDGESILRSKIQKSIENFSYESALFLAERLLSLNTTSVENSYLLAKCHYLMGNYKFSSSLLDLSGDHGQSVLLYASCCLKLELYSEGELILRKYCEQNQENGLEPFCYLMLGKLLKILNRSALAKEALLKAIQGDPLNWEAYKLLGDLGSPVKVSQYLNLDKFKQTSAPKAKSIISKPVVQSTRSRTQEVKKTTRIPFSSNTARPLETEQRKRNRQLTENNPLVKVILLIENGD